MLLLTVGDNVCVLTTEEPQIGGNVTKAQREVKNQRPRQNGKCWGHSSAAQRLPGRCEGPEFNSLYQGERTAPLCSDTMSLRAGAFLDDFLTFKLECRLNRPWETQEDLHKMSFHFSPFLQPHRPVKR